MTNLQVSWGSVIDRKLEIYIDMAPEGTKLYV